MKKKFTIRDYLRYAKTISKYWINSEFKDLFLYRSKLT